MRFQIWCAPCPHSLHPADATRRVQVPLVRRRAEPTVAVGSVPVAPRLERPVRTRSHGRPETVGLAPIATLEPIVRRVRALGTRLSAARPSTAASSTARPGLVSVRPGAFEPMARHVVRRRRKRSHRARRLRRGRGGFRLPQQSTHAMSPMFAPSAVASPSDGSTRARAHGRMARRSPGGERRCRPR